MESVRIEMSEREFMARVAEAASQVLHEEESATHPADSAASPSGAAAYMEAVTVAETPPPYGAQNEAR